MALVLPITVRSSVHIRNLWSVPVLSVETYPHKVRYDLFDLKMETLHVYIFYPDKG